MDIVQTRIHELIQYIQKESGESGYIDPSELMIAIDHPSWDESMKFPLSTSGNSPASDSEKGRLTNLASSTVNISWNFDSVPIGFHKVYRIVENGTYRRRHDVLILSEEVSSTGLTIVIDSSESLTGVIVEYSYESVI